jgi:Peptidase family M23
MGRVLRVSGVTRAAGSLALVVAVFVVWLLVGGAFSHAQTTAALRVEVSGAPRSVRGSDRREHIEYDLIVTNAFTADATLTSLEVSGRGKRLLSLTGAALAAATLRAGTSAPTDGRVPSASTVVTQIDLVLPRSVGRAVPVFLTNRIQYALPADAPARPIIAATTITPSALRVDPRAPVVIAAPVRGAGWLNANGCCNDPTSPHRQTVLATSRGGYDTPETFAIDWIRIVNRRQHSGDGSLNTEWPTYGSPLFAAADGTVVVARDDQPDIPPRSSNPDLGTPVDFSGNTVILKIAPDRYACYAHMMRGSVRVRAGQRVRVGQRIGLVGNSGNTDGPHLHFGIQRHAFCLSTSEPFEIDRYTLQGMAGPASGPSGIDLVGPRRRVLQSYPLIRSVATFRPPVRPR